MLSIDPHEGQVGQRGVAELQLAAAEREQRLLAEVAGLGGHVHLPSGPTAAGHWSRRASASPRSTFASSAYLLRGWRTTSVSARVMTWPQRLFASKVRPSRSAFRADFASRLVLYIPL